MKHADFKSVDPGLLLAKISFSLIIELMGEEDPMKRIFYEVETIKGNWSVGGKEKLLSASEKHTPPGLNLIA